MRHYSSSAIANEMKQSRGHLAYKIASDVLTILAITHMLSQSISSSPLRQHSQQSRHALGIADIAFGNQSGDIGQRHAKDIHYLIDIGCLIKHRQQNYKVIRRLDKGNRKL